MAKILLAIGLACGGEGGARLADRVAMPSSPESLLRAIRRAVLPTAQTPRVLGVDDWAFRRGQRYGTILCDLERHRPVDLLPERSSEAFANWLKAHPGVEIVSRDRGDYYIKGATAGAPDAVQVTDRWHLLKNLRERSGGSASGLEPPLEKWPDGRASQPAETDQTTDVRSSEIRPASSTGAVRVLTEVWHCPEIDNGERCCTAKT